MFACIATTAALVAAFLATQVVAFNVNCNNNLVLYWGTNSYFNTHGGSPQDGQLALKEYCASGSVDVVVLSFLDGVNVGSLPHIDIGWECDKSSVFPGTELSKCSQVGSDISYCQSQGAIVLLSIGGGAGDVGITGKSDGETFAQTLWDLFGGGSSNTRPFGNVKLDGFDLDIEGGDDSGYVYTFSKLRSLFASDSSKKYYLTGAPQCPYPGGGFMTNTLTNAWFDMLWPQFYNNYCGLNAQYNFGDWDGWANSVSINKNVKVFLGAPASSTAANSGYVDQSSLEGIISDSMSKFNSFGGVMFWDASQAWHNSAGGTNYGIATKNYLSSKGSCGKKPPSSSTADTSSSTTGTTQSISKARTTTTTTKSTTSSTATITKVTTSASTSTSAKATSTTTSTGGLPPCTAANNGAFQCMAKNSSPTYSECVNNNWVTFQCSSGTVCIQNSNTIYCGHAQ